MGPDQNQVLDVAPKAPKAPEAAAPLHNALIPLHNALLRRGAQCIGQQRGHIEANLHTAR